MAQNQEESVFPLFHNIQVFIFLILFSSYGLLNEGQKIYVVFHLGKIFVENGTDLKFVFHIYLRQSNKYPVHYPPFKRFLLLLNK